MTAVATIDQPSAPDKRPRGQSGDAAAFAALLLGAQSSALASAAGGVADATGTAPGTADDGDDPQRARIDGELDAARASEVQQRRGVNGQDSGGRADALRADGAGAGAKADADAEESTAVAAAPRSGLPAQASESKTAPQALEPPADADSGAEAAKSPGELAPKPTAERATPVSGEKPAAAPEPAPANETAQRNPVIAVSTAGAARASESAADAGKATAAQAVGKILAESTVRVDAPAAPAGGGEANNAKNGGAAKSQTPAGSTAGGQKSASTEAPRQTDFAQLVRMVRSNLGTRSSSATLRLEPPDLGKMKIDVRMTDDVLRLRIEVGSEEARGLLHERTEQLAAALKAHDIRMEQVEVVRVDQAGEDPRAGTQASYDARDGANRQQGEGSSAGSARMESAAALPAADANSILPTIDSTAQLDVRG